MTPDLIWCPLTPLGCAMMIMITAKAGCAHWVTTQSTVTPDEVLLPGPLTLKSDRETQQARKIGVSSCQ